MPRICAGIGGRFQSTLPTRGSDGSPPRKSKAPPKFQSTLPTRGSDRCGRGTRGVHYGFNPRSPRGGATAITTEDLQRLLFQSTLPTRGSDFPARLQPYRVSCVSIHAPHEGERRRKSAFVCSISANLLNIIHCGTVTRAVSRRRIALFRLFSVRRSGVFMYAYASH